LAVRDLRKTAAQRMLDNSRRNKRLHELVLVLAILTRASNLLSMGGQTSWRMDAGIPSGTAPTGDGPMFQLNPWKLC